MPSILSEADKETVKRFVPKQSNKIQAVAVARLYVAYPNRSKWTYTGLQGAAVLSNDLVGNTYWLKMVDISVSLPSHISHSSKAPADSPRAACHARSGVGSGDIRYMELQPRPNILPLLRARRLRGRSVFRRREGSEAIPEENERQGKEREQSDQVNAIRRSGPRSSGRSPQTQLAGWHLRRT